MASLREFLDRLSRRPGREPLAARLRDSVERLASAVNDTLGLLIQDPEICQALSGALGKPVSDMTSLAVAIWPAPSAVRGGRPTEEPERFDGIDRGDDWPEQRGFAAGCSAGIPGPESPVP